MYGAKRIRHKWKKINSIDKQCEHCGTTMVWSDVDHCWLFTKHGQTSYFRPPCIYPPNSKPLIQNRNVKKDTANRIC